LEDLAHADIEQLLSKMMFQNVPQGHEKLRTIRFLSSSSGTYLLWFLLGLHSLAGTILRATRPAEGCAGEAARATRTGCFTGAPAAVRCPACPLQIFADYQ
jgi:hypothetical protein